MKSQPTLMLIVHDLESKLPREELERRYRERMPDFRDVPGLVQKYYSYDADTEKWAGIYLWKDQASLDAYMESELKESIAAAYELVKPPQFLVMPIVDVLRTD